MHVTLLGYFQHLFAQFVCAHYRNNYTHTSERVNWLCWVERGVISNFVETPKGSIVTLAGSKIDSSKFNYFEKSVNLHICPFTVQGARGIDARFLKLSSASAFSPIMMKFSQYTPHSICYSVPVSICRQD